MYTVQIKVMPLKELLDPQGKAVMSGLQKSWFEVMLRTYGSVKAFLYKLTPIPREKAKQIAEEASKKLLANPVMEYFEIRELQS
mgnify:CR=1 FL=1